MIEGFINSYVVELKTYWFCKPSYPRVGQLVAGDPTLLFCGPG